MQESKDSKPFLVFLKNRHFKAVSGLQENCKDIQYSELPYTSSLFPIIFSNFIFIVDTIGDVPVSPHFAHLHPVHTPLPRPSPHCSLCLWVMHECSLANPFTFFHAVFSPCSPLTAVSLFHVSMPLVLCCSSVCLTLLWYICYN